MQNWLQFKKFEFCSGCQKIKLDQVPYGEPRLTFQQMYRLICQLLLNRHLTNTSVGYVPRVNTGRTSTNVGQYILIGVLLIAYQQKHIGQIPVNYRWYTGQLLVMYRLLHVVEK